MDSHSSIVVGISARVVDRLPVEHMFATVRYDSKQQLAEPVARAYARVPLAHVRTRARMDAQELYERRWDERVVINEVRGDLLRDPAEALVNTVNTVGIMGKGVALQFRQAFPQNYRAYRNAAQRGAVRLGEMFVVDLGGFAGPHWIVNFPTKGHWRARSRLTDISAGLDDLVRVIEKLGIRSIAIPPLGCGNGGLEWQEVRPVIVAAFAALPDVEVHLYEPAGAPDPTVMRVASRQLPMTWRKASLVRLYDRYLGRADQLTMIEAQKLAYLTEAAGADLDLRFEKAKFGPYAERLQHVLRDMEGQFTRGFGDRTTGSQIRVLPEAVPLADEALSGNHDAANAIDRALSIARGFAWPYGLELLTTVHWTAWRESPRASNPEDAMRAVLAWNRRKGRLFTREHIEVAWASLTSEGWLPVS